MNESNWFTNPLILENHLLILALLSSNLVQTKQQHQFIILLMNNYFKIKNADNDMFHNHEGAKNKTIVFSSHKWILGVNALYTMTPQLPWNALFPQFLFTSRAQEVGTFTSK